MGYGGVQFGVDRLSGRKGGHLNHPATQTILRDTMRGIIMTGTRENNPNWRGGRTKTSHGYILIRVGVGHPSADCRGYAYEHRLVAEKKIGRKLKPGEKVHHVDGDKQNNLPENITVVVGNGEHFFEHRPTDSNRQKPHEPNSTVLCVCGCGQAFMKYDKWGRPRKYISGHNTKERYANV